MTPGDWIGIGGIVVGVVTLYFVLEDRSARRRRHAWPTLMIDALQGVSTEKDDRTHRVWFKNAGGETAGIQTITPKGFRWILDDEPMPSSLRAHERVYIDLTTDDITKCWVRIIWVSESDVQVVQAEWMPLDRWGGSELADTAFAQLDAEPEYRGPAWLRRILFRRATRGRAVGPMEGGVPRRRHRSSGGTDAKTMAFLNEVQGVGATSKPD